MRGIDWPGVWVAVAVGLALAGAVIQWALEMAP